MSASQLFAEDLPASIDTGRIMVNQHSNTMAIDKQPNQALQSAKKNIPRSAPRGSDAISLELSSITFEGMTAFAAADFEAYLSNLYNKKLPSSALWDAADFITQSYLDAGYFLSRARIPQQEINAGSAKIVVIEGYISEINLQNSEQYNPQKISQPSLMVAHVIEDLKSKKPLRAIDLESALLKLSNIYGIEFEALLHRVEDGLDGQVALTLNQKKSASRGIIALNNHGSKFTGPLRANIAVEHFFAQGQKTSINGLVSLPSDELWSIGAVHSMQLSPLLEVDLLLSKSDSIPGDSLQQSNIKSDSTSAGIHFNWTLIRQRTKNLTLGFGLDALDSQTEIASTPLTHDKTRVARFSLDYDFYDDALGLNTFNLKLSQGLSVLGASKAADSNLSRQGAKPNFTKLWASFNHQKYLNNDFLLSAQIQGQVASMPLYTSEEFGFGGAYLGRAYDDSEITGDHGVAASLELQYTGFGPVINVQVKPFIFYDIGKAWNKGDANIKRISASSAGIGLRASGNSGLGFNSTLAFPLTKEVDNALYGDKKSPTLRFGLTYRFNLNWSAVPTY